MKDENPFQAPRSDLEPAAFGVVSGTREDLRRVAKYQRGILLCILIYFVALIGQFALPPGMRPLLGVGVLLVMLVSTVFVFLLATKLYGTVSGVLLGILTMIPLIGLIMLLILNGKATGILQQNKIKVGLLGADPSKI